MCWHEKIDQFQKMTYRVNKNVKDITSIDYKVGVDTNFWPVNIYKTRLDPANPCHPSTTFPRANKFYFYAGKFAIMRDHFIY